MRHAHRHVNSHTHEHTQTHTHSRTRACSPYQDMAPRTDNTLVAVSRWSGILKRYTQVYIIRMRTCAYRRRSLRRHSCVFAYVCVGMVEPPWARLASGSFTRTHSHELTHTYTAHTLTHTHTGHHQRRQGFGGGVRRTYQSMTAAYNCHILHDSTV